jgi:hypothetical protein
MLYVLCVDRAVCPIHAQQLRSILLSNTAKAGCSKMHFSVSSALLIYENAAPNSLFFNTSTSRSTWCSTSLRQSMHFYPGRLPPQSLFNFRFQIWEKHFTIYGCMARYSTHPWHRTVPLDDGGMRRK